MSASNDIDVELLQDEINDAAAKPLHFGPRNAELERALEAERGEVSRLAQLLKKAAVTPRSSAPKPSPSAPANSPLTKASPSARHTRNSDAVQARLPSPSASKSNFQFSPRCPSSSPK